MISEFKDIKAVIPARVGSERIKEKVYLPFGKTSLFEWKINQLLEVLAPKNIVVSTNSLDLIEIAEKYKVDIHLREDKYCVGNDLPFSNIVENIVSEMNSKHIAWTPFVTPLMSPRLYKEAFITYFEKIESGYDSLATFNLLQDYLWDEDGSLNYDASKNHVVSQELPKIYRITNSLYMAPREIMLKRKYFMGENPYKHVVDKVSGIDIDYLEDYDMAKALLPIYYKNEAIDNENSD